MALPTNSEAWVPNCVALAVTWSPTSEMRASRLWSVAAVLLASSGATADCA